METFLSTHIDIALPQNLGAIEIGLALSIALYGILLIQTHIYFAQRVEDGRYVKLLVAGLLFLETVHSVTAVQVIYLVTVTLANAAVKPITSNPLSVNILIESLVTVTVQGYFISRIHRISRRLLMSLVCCVLSIVRLFGGLAMAAACFLDARHKDELPVSAMFSWVITASFAVGAATDVLIAISMSYFLWKMASLVNKTTAIILNRLVIWSIQTGVVTSIASALCLACFKSMDNYVWVGVYLVLGKLYSNSVLVSLNSRPLHQWHSSSFVMDELQFAAGVNEETIEVSNIPTTIDRPAAV